MGQLHFSRKTAALITPRFRVDPSHAPYDLASEVKKNRRALFDEVCHPSIVMVSQGPRIHFEAPSALVVCASMEFRPSTESATAIRTPLPFLKRIEYSRPREASM